MATENGDGSVALIDLRTLRRTTLPPGDGSQAQPLGFSPDGHTLLTGDLAGRLTLWNVATHSESERSRSAPRCTGGRSARTADWWQFKRKRSKAPPRGCKSARLTVGSRCGPTNCKTAMAVSTSVPTDGK